MAGAPYSEHPKGVMNLGYSFRKALGPLLLVAGVTLIIRAPGFYVPLGRDAGVWGYIGSRILAGETPYVDVWDHKAPAIFAVNALALALSRNPSVGMRSLEVVWATMTGWSVYWLAQVLLRSRWSATAAALSWALSANGWLFSADGHLHFTEGFMQLPIVLGILFAVKGRLGTSAYGPAWRRSLLWSGVMGGLAILFKPTAGLFLGAVALYTVCQVRRGDVVWRDVVYSIAILGAGTLLPLAAVAALFGMRGGLSELYSQVIIYNWKYMASYADSIFSRTLLAQVQYAAIWIGFAWVPAVIGLVWGKVRHSRHLLLAWFVADLAGAVMIGGKHLPQYFHQVLPSLALLAGSGWDLWIERGWFSPRRARGVASLVFLSTSLTMFLYGQVITSAKWVQFRRQGNQTTAERAASSIAANSMPDESLYVWGAETVVHLLSGRKSASRYVYLYPLLAVGYGGPQRVEELLHDLAEEQPRYVIDASAGNVQVPPLSPGAAQQHPNQMYAQDSLEPVRQYILDNYAFERQIDQWKIYSRLGSDGP